MHIYPSTCPFFYSLDFLLFVINRQHQPLIESILYKDILFAIMYSLAQWKSDTTTTNLNKPNLPSSENQMKEEKITCITSKFPFLSFLPLSYSPNLHSMPQLPQPSITWCRLTPHSTQTNKTCYPCSQVSLKQ